MILLHSVHFPDCSTLNPSSPVLLHSTLDLYGNASAKLMTEVILPAPPKHQHDGWYSIDFDFCHDEKTLGWAHIRIGEGTVKIACPGDKQSVPVPDVSWYTSFSDLLDSLFITIQVIKRCCIVSRE